MVARVFNPITREAESGGSEPETTLVQSKFQENQGYTEKPCLEITKQKSKK